MRSELRTTHVLDSMGSVTISPYGIHEASCGTFRLGRLLMFDRFETHPRIERKASSVASFPRLVGIADLFLPTDHFKSAGFKN